MLLAAAPCTDAGFAAPHISLVRRKHNSVDQVLQRAEQRPHEHGAHARHVGADAGGREQGGQARSRCR